MSNKVTREERKVLAVQTMNAEGMNEKKNHPLAITMLKMNSPQKW